LKYALVLPALVAFCLFLLQESDLKISNAPITVFMLRLNRQQDLAEKESLKRLME
jgi:hypothetical protein